MSMDVDMCAFLCHRLLRVLCVVMIFATISEIGLYYFLLRLSFSSTSLCPSLLLSFFSPSLLLSSSVLPRPL